MSKIIAGRFDATVDADGALEALRREGFADDEIDSFYVPPAGQNAMAPFGGDAPHASAGSRFAGFGAVVGALVGAVLGALVGLAVDSRYGAVAVLFAAGVGAYLGSFVGTMRKVRRPSGRGLGGASGRAQGRTPRRGQSRPPGNRRRRAQNPARVPGARPRPRRRHLAQRLERFRPPRAVDDALTPRVFPQRPRLCSANSQLSRSPITPER